MHSGKDTVAHIDTDAVTHRHTPTMNLQSGEDIFAHIDIDAVTHRDTPTMNVPSDQDTVSEIHKFTVKQRHAHNKQKNEHMSYISLPAETFSPYSLEPK